MQEDIEVTDKAITGTLKAVTGYTGFSGDAGEQSGNYLALYIEVPDVDDATITAQLIGGVHGPVTLDSDGLLVVRVTSTTQKVKITASKDGMATVERTFSLSGVTLAS